MSQSINSDVQLRTSTLEDCLLYYQTRTSKGSIDQSISTTSFSYSTHQEWYYENFQKTDQLFFTIYQENRGIGYLRIQPNIQRKYFVSLAILPEFQGRGFGHKALAQCLEKAASKKIPILHAVVKRGNLASEKIFRQVGFSSYLELHDDEKEHLYFRIELPLSVTPTEVHT